MWRRILHILMFLTTLIRKDWKSGGITNKWRNCFTGNLAHNYCFRRKALPFSQRWYFYLNTECAWVTTCTSSWDHVPLFNNDRIYLGAHIRPRCCVILKKRLTQFLGTWSVEMTISTNQVPKIWVSAFERRDRWSLLSRLLSRSLAAGGGRRPATEVYDRPGTCGQQWSAMAISHRRF